MRIFLARSFILLTTACLALSTSAGAQTVYMPGVQIPAFTPQAAVGIMARDKAAHFFRRDDGPRYVIYGPHAPAPPFPRDLTPQRGRSYIDSFAAVAPRMGCRTDDIAHAYDFLIQAAMLAYNGTHFPLFSDETIITCGVRSFGEVSLDQNAHLLVGGTPTIVQLSNLQKQALYETLIVMGGYLLDNVQRAKPGSPQLVKARADADDVVRALLGVHARRVHFGEMGVAIDDQARP